MLFDLSTLRENILLDEAQMVAVRATVTSTQDFVASIDIKIRALENELSDLRTQRDAALGSIVIPQALLAPVRKLAPELLAGIFEYCRPEQPTHITPFDSREAPLLLTHICHRWRLVAQGSSRLWNHIVLYDRSPESHFSSLWFNNSSTLPLYVTIECDYKNSWGDWTLEPGILASSEYPGHGWREDRYLKWNWPRCTEDQSQEMARAVVKQYSRIRSLKMTCSAQRLRDYFPLERTTNIILPSLHELSVNIYDFRRWDSEEDDTTSPLYIPSPQLRILTLHFAAEILLPAIRCTSSLRELHINYNCNLKTLMDFIKLCPALELIDALRLQTEGPPSHQTQYIAFPKLLHLGLGIVSRRRARASFVGSGDSEDWGGLKEHAQWLRTLNLRSMKLQSCPYGKRVLSACLAESRPGLRKLSLEKMKLERDSIDDLIGIFAEVEDLVIVNSETHQGFWGSLIPEEGALPSTWGFPKLKSLTLESTDVVPEDTLVQLVERRAQPLRMEGEQPLGGVYYLEEISITSCDMSVETVNTLVQLGESRDGLSVKIYNTKAWEDGR